MSNHTPKQKIDVDQLAAGNPAIDSARFKDWQQKMQRVDRLRKHIEDLGINQDKQRDPPPNRMQTLPIRGRRVRFGNISG